MSGHVDLPAAAVIATVGMVTASVGARAAHAMAPKTLQLCLGAFMILVAPTMPLKQDIVDFARALGERHQHDAQDDGMQLHNPADTGSHTVVGAGTRPPQQEPEVLSAQQLSVHTFVDQCWTYLRRGVGVVGAGSGFLGGLFGVGGGAYAWRCMACVAVPLFGVYQVCVC